MVYNLGRSTDHNIDKTKPLIVCNSHGHSICLNNWQNKYYFIDTFPTLVMLGDGKKLAKRKTDILFKT